MRQFSRLPNGGAAPNPRLLGGWAGKDPLQVFEVGFMSPDRKAWWDVANDWPERWRNGFNSPKSGPLPGIRVAANRDGIADGVLEVGSFESAHERLGDRFLTGLVEAVVRPDLVHSP